MMQFGPCLQVMHDKMVLLHFDPSGIRVSIKHRSVNTKKWRTMEANGNANANAKMTPGAILVWVLTAVYDRSLRWILMHRMIWLSFGILRCNSLMAYFDVATLETHLLLCYTCLEVIYNLSPQKKIEWLDNKLLFRTKAVCCCIWGKFVDLVFSSVFMKCMRHGAFQY